MNCRWRLRWARSSGDSGFRFPRHCWRGSWGVSQRPGLSGYQALFCWRARHGLTGERSPGATPSSIGHPRSIQRKPLWARVEPGLSKRVSEARWVKHEWLHRTLGEKDKGPTGQSFPLVHKGPLVLASAGGSISDKR